jgi:hypothetical protein
MKRFFMIFLMCIALLTLTACIQVDTVVKIKTDGSGVIEETFLMKKDFLQQMKITMEEMAKSMDQVLTEGENSDKTQQSKDSRVKAEKFDIFDEGKLKGHAKDMGEGVTYLKGSKIITDDYEGYKAIYEFTDISKVKINKNKAEKVLSDPQQISPDSKASKEYITFTFTKGEPAELLIKSPGSRIDKKSEDISEDLKPSQDDVKASEEMMAKMKEMFHGMKIALAVEVDGNILETNASHREGSKITLLELDFGKLMEMPEVVKRFSQSKPKNAEDLKLLIQDLPGIKVDLNNEIRIRFDQQKVKSEN